ncbi:MAG: aminomethyl-transferring glycine dehydrogenase subunit GcvPB [Candidatus Bathyarchaeia archaeon]|jgi:glycine dehydrogenase subunit 2|nr:aminomethyl-transferring glycine dehydrogenase subunit GcvPB [Candidatus Bathyarchaeota archaeon A05DMB-4]MDH7595679.1 aminomethyl-transferring glycine dehydrogenase subunit GcvPB [Candidatus Bathyarchaeota archaeon]
MSTFRQARWNEPIIFELGKVHRRGFALPEIEEEIKQVIGDVQLLMPQKMKRETPPKLPELSEVEVTRHFIRLSQMNYGVDSGLYPLGSCTMKYNPKINDALATSPTVALLHPYQDPQTTQGILQILYTLSRWLAEITGTYEVCLQPSAGAHGELLGVLIIRAYHKRNGELKKRSEIIVPDSAHGTNPASATMGGYRVIVVPSDADGCVDIEALKSVVSERTAGLMLTNPNTLGIFEKNIEEIARIVHEAGGLLYYDGANLNAILGKTRPGDMGFDIVHINIHKTFGTPHGGGGPGAGPVGVSEELERFLPVPRIGFDGKDYFLDYNKPDSVGKIRSFYGNIAVLVRAYAYILSLGAEGLQEVAEVSVLNANYLAKKLAEIRGFELPYDKQKPRKHECVISAKPMAKETGVKALNVSKRLLDYGVHAPTTYFPLIVDEALMIEPTESFEKEELDRFVDAVKKISQEAYSNPQLVLNAPQNTACTRLDEVKASHPQSMALSWKMYLKKRKDI